MLPDEKEWSAVNQLLKQQGLTPIVILNEINVNDYVWLTLEASKSLRLTIQTLIGDCQRKQVLVSELMSTNADLREQLRTYSHQNEKSNHVIEEMRRVLDTHLHNKKMYLGEEFVQNFKLDIDNSDIHKKNINYDEKINNLNLLDSEILHNNNDKNFMLKNKIDQLKIEIGALKQTQEKTISENLSVQRQNFEAIVKELKVNDIPSAIQKIRSIVNKYHNHEMLKNFICDIYEIISNVDKNIIRSKKHEITCDKNLNYMKLKISDMAYQISLIPQLIDHINNLLLPFFPHKFVYPLDKNSDLQQVINFLIELSMMKFENHFNMHPVKDEEVTSESLHSIIEYIQMLFGIKSIKGMYASMSSIYRRLAEQENMMKSLQMLLSNNDKLTCSKLVTIVSNLNRQNQSNDHHLENELRRISDVMANQESYISIFQKMISDLQSILSLNSPDHILPKVKQLIEKENRIIID